MIAILHFQLRRPPVRRGVATTWHTIRGAENATKCLQCDGRGAALVAYHVTPAATAGASALCGRCYSRCTDIAPTRRQCPGWQGELPEGACARDEHYATFLCA